MTRTLKRPKNQGLSLIDVLVVIGTLSLGIIIAFVFAPSRQRSSRVSCIYQLKQVGTAARMWANDNQDRFPWSSTNLNDKLLEPYAYWLLATNELNSPKALVCPQDKSRTRALAFDKIFSNKNLSYFIGLDADETKPQTILAGDRTLSTNRAILSGLVKLQGGATMTWAPGIHTNQGNIAFSDGSAQSFGNRFRLPRISNDVTGSTPRLLIP